MKTKAFPLVVFNLMLMLAVNVAFAQNDDVYFTPSKGRNQNSNSQNQGNSDRNVNSFTPNESNSARNSSDESSNANFEGDDYYDYSYASRIRRFHNPNAGFGYYDPWYTNMYYFDNNPANFGTSIYSTYGFWNPAPSMVVWSRPFGWGWGFGFGPRYNWDPFWGWNSAWYGYDPFWGWNNPWAWNSPFHCHWNSPWAWNYGWNRPWGAGWGYGAGYWNGYNHGYWHGYQNGLVNSMYFNSFDRNSYYYGRRNSMSSTGRNAVSDNGRLGLGQKYIQSVANDRANGISTPANTVMRDYIESRKNDFVNPKAIDGRPTVPSIKDREVNTNVRDNNTVNSPSNPSNATPARDRDWNPGVRDNNVANPTAPNLGNQGRTPENNQGVRSNNNFDYLPSNTGRPIDNAVKESPRNNNHFDTKVPDGRSNNNFSGRDDYYNGSRNNSFETKRDRNEFMNDFNSGRNENWNRRNEYSRPERNNGFDSRPSGPRFEAPSNPGRNNRQYDSPRNDRPRMGSPRMQSPRMESPKMQSPRMESPRMQSSPSPSMRGGGGPRR